MSVSQRSAARIEQRVTEAMMSAVYECMAELAAIARQPLYETLVVKRNGPGRGDRSAPRRDGQTARRCSDLQAS